VVSLARGGGVKYRDPLGVSAETSPGGLQRGGNKKAFSCSGFFLSPSGSQKRTLLFAEYLDEQLLFALPTASSSSPCPRP